MHSTITEKTYPVEDDWIFKIPLNFFIVTVFMIVFLSLIIIPIGFSSSLGILMFIAVIGSFFIIMIIIGFISTMVAILSKNNFHYSVDQEFMIFHQGIISKQQKNLPYGVIQDIILNQDIADRILNLVSLSIENASFGGGQTYMYKGRPVIPLIGFGGNVAIIPGLKKENAEKLKTILLTKMKEFQTQNNQGGL